MMIYLQQHPLTWPSKLGKMYRIIVAGNKEAIKQRAHKHQLLRARSDRGESDIELVLIVKCEARPSPLALYDP